MVVYPRIKHMPGYDVEVGDDDGDDDDDDCLMQQLSVSVTIIIVIEWCVYVLVWMYK